jgi:predicted ATPase/DNA-binding CsgD family transcriptional regulator
MSANHTGEESVSITPTLPLPLTPLIGRESELAELGIMLAQPDVRLINLTGLGGVGKTRLALAAAERVAGRFPDGVTFVPLAAISEPGLVFHAILQALQLTELSHRSALEQLAQTLRERRSLIVLDNFEQVRAAAPRLSTLLAACPDLKLLVTSRVTLRIQSEHEYPVPPMAVTPTGDGESAKALAQMDAVRLFAQRAEAVRHDFRLTETNLPAVVEICRRLDGLPLAIELAATRVRLLSPQTLLKRLTNRLHVLTSGPQDLPSRQQTLRATIDWSSQLLEPAERVLFQRLAVFAGGWTIEAAEAVAGPGIDIEILDGLAALVDHHLVQSVEQPNGTVRFAMLETIREYALEQLAQSGDASATQARHWTYCLRLAESVEAAIRGSRSVEVLAALDGELGNFRAALSWALEQDDPDRVQELAGTLQWFWWAQNSFREGGEWFARGLAKGAASPGVYARAQVGAGGMAQRLGQSDLAVEWLEAGIATLRDIGDLRGAGYGLFQLGMVRSSESDQSAAVPYYLEALECFERDDDRWGIPLALSYLGYALYESGEHDEGLRRVEQAVPIARERGGETLSGVLLQLGFLALSRGDHARALESLSEAATLDWTWKAMTYQARFLLQLGALLLEFDRPESSVRVFAAAATVAVARGYSAYSYRLKQYHERLDRARAALGENVFERAWTEGAALSHDDVIELVESELRAVSNHLAGRLHVTSGTRSNAFDLTPRELEILRLLAAGRSSQEIADDLFISAHTVKRHIANILGKLEVSSRAAAVALAFQHHLV